MLDPASLLFRVNEEGNVATPACRRVQPEDLPFTEAQIRDLLARHPELVQGPLAAGGLWDEEKWYYVGSEVRVAGVGMIDLLFVDDSGKPILIETKLFKNPEARRQVVTQVTEYALHLGSVRAGALLGQRKHPAELDDLLPDIDDHLRRGLMTLVIVGDAVDERAIRLAEALLAPNRPDQRSLAFVELGFFTDMADSKPTQWLVVPQLRRGVTAQVREVFEFRVMDAERELAGHIRATAPEPPRSRSDTITEEVLLNAIASTQGPDGRHAAEALLALARTLGAEIVYRQSGASVRVRDPQGSDARITLFVLSDKGTFYVYGLNRWERIGADPNLAIHYRTQLEFLLGARVAYPPTDASHAVPLRVVAQRLERVQKLVTETAELLKGTV